MAGRFNNPFPQFMDATPTMYSGGKLFFYASGTSTKQNTYSDAALSSANTNPVVLNSAGRPSVDIYLQDLSYKVVLAPSTDTDPPASPIWTADNYTARDSKLIAKTLTGSGSPSGVVAGTAGSSSVLPDFYWDYTNAILYVCTATGTTSTAVWTALNASTAAAVVPTPQGYLTPTGGGVPVIPSDVAAATVIYYTPFVGNIIPIYNGTAFIPTVFTELPLTLVASHAASNIYDVFVFSNSGVPTLVTGPSWSAGTSGSITAGSCARGTGAGGTALARLSGTLTNTVQITGRNGSSTFTIAANQATYVGSLFMDGSNGQITCHRSLGQSRKWGIWNAFNKQPISLQVADSTASWVYATATIRASNAASANSLTTFTGLAEEQFSITFNQNCQPGAGATGLNGIGWNSTTAFVTGGKVGFFGLTGAGQAGEMCALYTNPPALGINVVTCLENTAVTGVTFYGTTTNKGMLMLGSYRA